MGEHIGQRNTQIIPMKRYQVYNLIRHNLIMYNITQFKTIDQMTNIHLNQFTFKLLIPITVILLLLEKLV